MVLLPAGEGVPGTNTATPVFDGAKEDEITGLLGSTLPNRDGVRVVKENGKAMLFDGRSGEPFPEPVSSSASPALMSQPCLASQPRCSSRIWPMFIRRGTPSGLSTTSTGVPSSMNGMSSTGRILEMTPLLP